MGIIVKKSVTARTMCLVMHSVASVFVLWERLGASVKLVSDIRKSIYPGRSVTLTRD